MTNLLQEKPVFCPYCGEPITLLVDASLAEQQYVEDCSVCCQPMEIAVHCDGEDCFVDVRSDQE